MRLTVTVRPEQDSAGVAATGRRAGREEEGTRRGDVEEIAVARLGRRARCELDLSMRGAQSLANAC